MPFIALQPLSQQNPQAAVVDTMQTRAELYDRIGYHAYEERLDVLFARDDLRPPG